MREKFPQRILNKYASKWVVLCFDVLLVCVAFILAYLIRFNFSFNFDTTNLKVQIVLVIGASIVSFLLVGSYKGIIRHTGTRDVSNIFFAVTIYMLLIGVIVWLNNILGIYKGFTIPKSIVFIHCLVTAFLLIISRYIFKVFYEVISTDLKSITNVLIYGAGDFGRLTYSALDRGRGVNYDIIGFLDDDVHKVHKKIDQIKIYNPKKIDKEFIDVIPERMMTNIPYIASVLNQNALKSATMRKEIREYAETFSWKSVIENVYLPSLEKVLSKLV